MRIKPTPLSDAGSQAEVLVATCVINFESRTCLILQSSTCALLYNYVYVTDFLLFISFITVIFKDILHRALAT